MREIAQQALLFPATRIVAQPTVIGAADLIHAPQPAILAPNHESDIDTPLVLMSLPHSWRAHTVVGAASDRFYRKRGYAIASGFWINTFPFDRGGGQRRGLAAAAAHLRDGRNVLLFPQGTRGAGPEGYRAGVAELALTAGAPIIPIHIEGTALVMPKGRGLNRRAKTSGHLPAPAAPARRRDARGAHRAPAGRHRTLRLIEFFTVPPEQDEAFVAVWRAEAPPGEALYRALRIDVQPRFASLPFLAPEGVLLLVPFEDEGFPAAWEPVREVFAARQGFVGAQLLHDRVAVVHWSSPLMYDRAVRAEGDLIAALPFAGHPALYGAL